MLERADAQARAPGRSGRARGTAAPLRPRQPRAGVSRHARPPATKPRRAPPNDRRARPAFSPRRIRGMRRRHWYLLCLAGVLELAYWPTVQMILWGFVTKFLAGHTDLVAQAAGVFLSAVLLWDVLFRGHSASRSFHGGDVLAPSRASVRLALRPYELVCRLRDERPAGADRCGRRRVARDPDPPVLDLRRARPRCSHSSSISCGSAGRWA